MPGRVFISHSHHDKSSAEEIVAALEQRGVPCWIAPRDVPPGGSYADALFTAIQEASCFVLLYTQHVNLSPHVLREVECALNAGVNIVPVRFDQSQVSKSLGYFLATVHWLSVSEGKRDQGIQHAAGQIATTVGQIEKMQREAPYIIPQGAGSGVATAEVGSKKRFPAGWLWAGVALTSLAAVLALGWHFKASGLERGSTAAANTTMGTEARASKAGGVKAHRIRVALVIGNNRYSGVFPPLVCAVPDAVAIAGALEAKGFQVMLKKDLNRAEMIAAIEQFQTLLSLGGTGLVYYAGHGCQIEGEDYFIPVSSGNGAAQTTQTAPSLTRAISIIKENVGGESMPKNEAELKAYSVNVTHMLAPVAKLMSATPDPSGEVIMYSTAMGAYAYEGKKDFSPFCEAVLESLKEPKTDLDSVFKSVSVRTRKLSHNLQVPWVSKSFDGVFDFSDPQLDEELGILKILLIDTCRVKLFGDK